MLSRRLLPPLLTLLTAAAVAACGVEPEPDTLAGDDRPVEASTSPSPSRTTVTPSTTRPAEDRDDGGSGEEASSREESGRGQPAAASDCDAYVNSGSWCRDGIGDYDCEGGSGNGPNYAPRGIQVRQPGVDPFGLDDDGDGEACERPASSGGGSASGGGSSSGGGTDPRFGTCREAKANGYGPYYRGQDPEYSWYRDADGDGVVCE